MSTRIARLTLKDGFGNESTLDLREGANGELVARLATAKGIPEATSNMQAGRLPAFWEKDRSETLRTVKARIARGTRKVIDCEARLAR